MVVTAVFLRLTSVPAAVSARIENPSWSKRPLIGAALLAACGLAVIASFTHPFTLAANVITAIPLAVMLAAEATRLVRSHGSLATGTVRVAPANWARSFVPWIALSCAVIAFELFNYFELPRRAHPTLSSLSDELTHSHAGRAVLFLAWLALGAVLLRSAPRRDP